MNDPTTEDKATAADTYDRARLSILSRVIQAATGTRYEHDSRALAIYGFDPQQLVAPRKGDLVRIESCSPTKWYLSWFVEMLNPEWNECILESIEDREECEWSNIGLSVFDRDVVANHPEWAWTDSQFHLWDRWRNPDPDDEPYIVMPVMPKFDGDRVLLRTRIRFGLGDPPPERWFENWRTITDEQLTETYRQAVRADNERPKRQPTGSQ